VIKQGRVSYVGCGKVRDGVGSLGQLGVRRLRGGGGGTGGKKVATAAGELAARPGNNRLKEMYTVE